MFCIIGGGILVFLVHIICLKLDLRYSLRKDKIASKTTGHTTGKITSQHGLFINI